jgi:5-methylcytosine-specific restriction endonuclease McrA
MTIGYPKPERRARTKRRRERQQRRTRAVVRAIVLARAGGRCERCGRRVFDDVEAWRPDRAHVHEVVPRSRGGSRYDPENCVCWCAACHVGGGAHRVEGRRKEG